MMKILELEIIMCKVCKHEISEENKSYILSCGNTLCHQCQIPLTAPGSQIKCPFDQSHCHANESPVINFSYNEIVEQVKNHLSKSSRESQIHKNVQSLILQQSMIINLKNSLNLSKTNQNANTKYKGQYVNGKKQGEGEFYTNEFQFVGNFQNDLPVGPGKLIFYGKGIYKGAFLGDYDKGKGTIMYENGDKYIGNWSNYMKTGRGKLILSNGNIYEGDFKNDIFEGEGALFIKEDQKQIEGNWTNGKENGIFLLYSKKSKYPIKAKYNDGILDTILELECIEGYSKDKQFLIE